MNSDRVAVELMMKRLQCNAGGLWLAVAPTSLGAAYQPTWTSVDQHNSAPEWFQDAKFGIYFHWGPAL